MKLQPAVFKHYLPTLGITWLLGLSPACAAAAMPCDSAWSARDYAEVIRLCQSAAEQGNARAAYQLGEAWDYNPDNNLRSGIRAARWYRIAADQGHALAQRNLATLYDSGFGVPRDPWHAYKWYRMAAEQNQPHSQLMVGMMLMDGTGVHRDPAEGRQWIGRAAKAGESSAQYMYGKLLYKSDPAAAIGWFLKSAEQDNRYALYRLGLLYYRGDLLGRDPERALLMAEKAIAAGHPRAAFLKQKILEALPSSRRPSIATTTPSTGPEQAPEAKSQHSAATTTPRLAVGPAKRINQRTGADLHLNAPGTSASAEASKPGAITSNPAAAAVTHAAPRSSTAATIAVIEAVEKVSETVASETSAGIVTRSPAASASPLAALKTPAPLIADIARSHNRVTDKPGENEADGADWLLRQPPGAYSIQLALMSRYSSIQRFFRLYGMQQQAHFYRARFNAGPMYVLLWGNFSSLAEARAAMAELPPAVQKMKPWVRQFRRLQQGFTPVTLADSDSRAVR